MEKYRFLKDESTADISFIAYGKDMNELFKNSAHALLKVMISKDKIKAKKTVKFKIKSNKIDDLLVKFLDKIIFLKDYEHIVLIETKVNITDKYELNCTGKAESLENLKKYFLADVKATTMHNLMIKKEKGLIKCKVVLDI